MSNMSAADFQENWRNDAQVLTYDPADRIKGLSPVRDDRDQALRVRARLKSE